MDRQCSSCGGFCKKSGCERENVTISPKREWQGLTDDEMQKIIKLVAKKCAEIADTAEPYQSADLIRKHFGVEK
jgi:predicted Fe-S protein YdhL (DUF1289 family)